MVFVDKTNEPQSCHNHSLLSRNVSAMILFRGFTSSSACVIDQVIQSLGPNVATHKSRWGPTGTGQNGGQNGATHKSRWALIERLRYWDQGPSTISLVAESGWPHPMPPSNVLSVTSVMEVI
jgi:hypothetical protein